MGQRRRRIALVQSATHLTSRMTCHMLAGILDGAEATGLELGVVRLDDERLSDEAFMRGILDEAGAEGLLLNYHFQIPPRMVELVCELQLPAIWINSSQDSDCVRPDDRGAGLEATRRLIEIGHRRIAYACYSHGRDDLDRAHYSVHDREQGYRDALEEAGLDACVVRSDLKVPGQDREFFTVGWLSDPGRPTAVVCYGDVVALPVLLAARNIEVTIPEELSLVTFADAPFVLLGYAVTSMVLPDRQMGREAVEMLVEKMADPARRLAPRVLPMRFDYGSTLAPPHDDH